MCIKVPGSILSSSSTASYTGGFYYAYTGGFYYAYPLRFYYATPWEFYKSYPLEVPTLGVPPLGFYYAYPWRFYYAYSWRFYYYFIKKELISSHTGEPLTTMIA